MRKLYLTIAITGILSIPLPALAESNTVSGSTSGSYAGSQSGVVMNSKSSKAVGTAIAPGLASSGLSCSGSASVGAGGGGWGVSFGMTKKDDYCNAREDAKYIISITGDKPAAKERLCDTDEIRKAFARVGRPCYLDRVKYASPQPKRRR